MARYVCREYALGAPCPWDSDKPCPLHTLPGDHFHNLTGEDVSYTPCRLLTHCPSDCYCDPEHCTAILKSKSADYHDHNERCNAYAVGCAVQNIAEAMADQIKDRAAGRFGRNTFDPWDLDVVTVGLGYREGQTVSCYCHMTERDFADSRSMLATLTLGYVAITNHAR